MNGRLIHQDNTNFKGTNFKTSQRTRGFFGRRNPTYEQDNIVYGNYSKQQISVIQSNEYQYQTELIPECITKEILDFILFGNEVFANDYNLANHSYDYRLFPVILESNEGNLKSSLISLTYAAIVIQSDL